MTSSLRAVERKGLNVCASRTRDQDPFGLRGGEEAGLAVEGGPAPVAGEQAPGGGLGGGLGGPLRRQQPQGRGDVLEFCRHKVVHVHAGGTRRVLLALAEDVMGAAEALAEAPPAPATPGGRHDVGTLGGLHVVGLPAETQEQV